MWPKHGTDDHHIIIGDNLSVMRDMPSESIDLIYADPPFNTGRDFGDYNDRWNTDDVYMSWLNARLTEMHRLLKPTGSIYLHCDQHMGHYIKVSMDRIWGRKQFRNDIIWKRADAKNIASKQFSRDTDNILFYAKDANKSFFNIIRKAGGNVGVDNGKLKVRIDSSGRKFFHHSLRAPTSRPNGMFDYRGVKPPPTGWCMTIEKMDEMYKKDGMELNDKGTEWKRKRYIDDMAGPLVGNCWDDIKRLGPRDGERTGWATQKPLALLRRIIAASSQQGDLVLDPFVGSGTTIEAAHQLGRRAIGIDINADTPAIGRVEGLKERLI